MNDSDMQALVSRYVAAYNAFDVDGMVALLSPDVRFENYSGGALTVEATGIAEFRRLAEQSRGMFSEREQRITHVQFDANSAVADIDYRGRLAVDIPDGPVAGTVIALQGQSEFHFVGGRIGKLVDRS